jgi:peptide/nickel transport system permease protein
MVAALSAPYVKVARSKGASEKRVVFGHALRNATTPVLTVAGDLATGLVNGAVIVETIFGWPGIGKLTIDATRAFDYPILMGVLLVTSMLVVLANLLADIAYGIVDPRIQY